jgi:acyl-[acyl-carrier-protein]-phospholipid O-acyltransferase / long-chain-fatty-acid--[acyl-carrier-protein] ligase
LSTPTDTSSEAWQEYVHSLPTIGEQWIDTSCRKGNPVVLSDTLGTRLKSRQALTGSIVISRRIAKRSPEQNVGLLLPTSAGGMLANLAGILLGKTMVNLNFTASLDALLSAISQADIKVVYSSSRFLQKLEERGFNAERLKQEVTVIMLEDVNASVSTLEKALTLLLCSITPAFLLKKLFCAKHSLDVPAVVLFSSGSEGEPKGVVLSHRNLITNVKQIVDLLQIQEDDLVLANLPLFHAFGLTVTLFMPLLERVPVFCHPDPTDAYVCAKTISNHKVSLMFGTSTFFRLYVRNNKVQGKMLESLRLIIAGAEKLQKEVSAEFKAKFNKVIYEGYGTTETSPVASVNTPDSLRKAASTLKYTHKHGSVGLPMPGTNIKIVDPDTFEELSMGDGGLVLINGGQVMQGYLNDPKKSADVLKVIDDQIWYASGDKGYLDEDGFLFIQDRYSRFAKIGGEMVSLGSVEAAIRQVLDNPELDVVAVNIPDDKKGEKIVVLSNQILDKSVLRDKLSKAGLNALALPSSYIKVDEVPTLGTGKTDFATAKEVARKIVL